MNLGVVNGLFDEYECIGSLWAHTVSQLKTQGAFPVPPEATLALVSGCAGGDIGAPLRQEQYNDPATGDMYAENQVSGGGGGAACFRVSYPLGRHRFIPWGLQYGSVYIGVDPNTTNSGEMCLPWNADRFRHQGGIISLAAGGYGYASTGGDGGAAISYGRLDSAVTFATVVASGGAGAAGYDARDGTVRVLPCGGLLAGGGGGSLYASNDTGFSTIGFGTWKAGRVRSPLRHSMTSLQTSDPFRACGGASLYADGIEQDATGNYVNGFGYTQRSSYSGRMGGSAVNNGETIVTAPGAGSPAGVPRLNTMWNSFVMVEFFKPRG